MILLAPPRPVREVQMPNQAKAYLSALFESTEDPIWSVDTDDRLITFNSALKQHIESAFGVRLAAGMTPKDIFPPERAGLLPPLYERARAEGPIRVEFSLTGGRTMDLALSPIRAEGKVAGVSVFGKDITKRKAAENALKEAEKKYREIFNGALEGMFQTSPEGKCLTANPALAKMLGYDSPEEFISMAGNVIQEVWANHDEHDHCLRLLREHGAVLGFECQFKRKDGRNAWVSLNARMVCGTSGQLLYHEGLIIDITERRRAEQTLAESEARFRGIFAENGSVMLFVDPQNGEIFDANPAASSYYGYTHEQLVGMPIARINTLPPEEIAEEWNRALREECSHFSFHHRLASGEVRDVDVYSSPVDVDGKPLLFSIVHDVTERTRAEIALRENEESLRESQSIAGLGSYDMDLRTGLWKGTEVMDAVFGIDKRYKCDVEGWAALVHPSDRAMMTAYFAEEIAGKGQPFNKEYRIVRPKDLAERWVHGMGRLDFDAQGQPVRMRGTIRDITEQKQAEARLRESEERYRTVFHTSPDAVMISQLSDGVVLDVNEALLTATKFERDEVIGHTTLELGIWVNASDRQKMMEDLLRNHTCRGLEVHSRRKNGEIFWMQLSASLIEIGGRQCVLAFARDISEAKAAVERLAAAQEALKASEERYRTVFHTSLDCITISRLCDGQYIDVNKAFLDLIGIEAQEIVGRTSTELGIWAYPGTRTEIVEMLRQNSSFRDFQTQFVKKTGEIFPVLISASVIEIGGDSCLVSVVRDTSGAKAAEKTIQSLAFYDPLTGLPNRRRLLERLRQYLSASPQSNRLQALLLVDLDNLKTLNDTLGHQTGDLLLQEVARRIAACTHEADTVGRLGSDEFVVLLDGLSEGAEEAAAQAKAVGERILASVDQPYQLENRECLSAASIGITVFGDRQNSTDDILQQADIALHLAKGAGRNTIRFFSPALQSAINARATLEEDLHQAIKKKQFLLYLQPQVERGHLTGAEALIRWKHALRGIVPPDEFIPLAEESRLILPIGDWVLETACTQLASWATRKETAHLTISVNISALQFRQPEFVEQVLAALARTGANPRNLKLELTESMLVESFEEVISRMTELKSHGLSFSLDDFGTGYSSLAYLKRLPLDQLKIDRAFIRDMLVDATSGAIAQTIISLGRAMNLSVVAEGVETEEQRGFLAGLGCHSFQGYLFSRPVPVDEFRAFV